QARRSSAAPGVDSPAATASSRRSIASGVNARSAWSCRDERGFDVALEAALRLGERRDGEQLLAQRLAVRQTLRVPAEVLAELAHRMLLRAAATALGRDLVTERDRVARMLEHDREPLRDVGCRRNRLATQRCARLC